MRTIDWRALAFSALALGFLIGAVSLLPHKQPPAQPAISHEKSENYQNGIAAFQRARIVIGDFVHVNRDEITAVSTLVMAIFTATLFLATYGQLRHFRREFNTTYRPRIEIFGVEAVSSIAETEMGEEDERVVVWVHYVNAGETPARLTEIAGKITTDNSFGILFKPYTITKANTVEIGQERLWAVESAYRMSQLQEVRTTFYCVGYFAYEDKRGVHRKTGYCWRYSMFTNSWVREEDSPYEYSY